MLLSGSCADQTDCVCVPCSCSFTCSTDGTVTSVCTRCILVIMHIVVGIGRQRHRGGGGGQEGRRRLDALVEILDNGSLSMLILRTFLLCSTDKHLQLS